MLRAAQWVGVGGLGAVGRAATPATRPAPAGEGEPGRKQGPSSGRPAAAEPLDGTGNGDLPSGTRAGEAGAWQLRLCVWWVLSPCRAGGQQEALEAGAAPAPSPCV